MRAAENKALVQRIFEGIANGDRSLFRESLTDDFAWVITGKSSWAGRYDGGFKAVQDNFLRPLYTRFAKPNLTSPHRITAEDNIVVVEATGNTETPECTAYRNQYCLIYVFRDGKIAEQIEYMDHAYCEAVLGKWDDVLAAYRQRLP